MDQFAFYFNKGISHITDVNGLDHMIFIITLCAIYSISQWRQILILITAFTIGHSVTLALSSLDIIRVNQNLIETLIPVTILTTSIFNVTRKTGSTRKFHFNYLLAMGFGLIHGMGFSNFFRAMMTGITDDSIIFPLFTFNLGIEVGQLFIVCGFLVAMLLFVNLLKVKPREWNLYISGAGGGLALTMIADALF